VSKRNTKSPRRAPGRPKSRLTARVTLRGNRGRQDDPELESAMRAVASAAPPPMMLSDRTPRPRRLSARFDAAQTTDDNRRHWGMSDGLSADAASNPGVRYILRNRARYEVANNTYARGLVLTIANDVVGTGPRLQMQTPNADVNRKVERQFSRWAREVRLAEKLRTMRAARVQDGEAFGILTSNPGLASPVKLDLRLIEADQVTFTDVTLLTVPSVDGIVFDKAGNPVEYHVLRIHPGNYAYFTGTIGFPWEYDKIPAKDVVHWFRQDRPGQHRGIPELTPALPLFAQLRRFTLAVLDAAEAAADFAIVLYTKAPADGEAEAVEPMDTIELERRMMTTLPEGWEPGQIKAEQPATTYREFKGEILDEIARCLNVPSNVARGNSSAYNYASGRLDHQTYYRQIRVDQQSAADVVLDRIFSAWMDEAILVSDLLPLPARTMAEYPHQWFWDGHEHVDPAKEATAQQTRLASNTTTLAAEYARQGKDWEPEIRQRAKEIALCKQLGVTPAVAAPLGQAPGTPAAPAPAPAPVPADDGEPPDDSEPPPVDETEDL